MTLVGSWADFRELKLLARICLDVSWDELNIDYARIFISHGDYSVRDIRARVRFHAGVGEGADVWTSQSFLTDFNGTILDDLDFLYRLRHDWTEDHEDPAGLPPMFCRGINSRELNLVPGPLRNGLFDL